MPQPASPPADPANLKLKLDEVAVSLRMSKRHVFDLLKDGHFPHAHRQTPAPKSPWLIPQADLDAYVAARVAAANHPTRDAA